MVSVRSAKLLPTLLSNLYARVMKLRSERFPFCSSCEISAKRFSAPRSILNGPVGACGRGRPVAMRSRTLPRHLQPGGLPQPIGSPETHLVTVATQEDPNAPIAVARVLCRKRRHARQHSRVLLSQPRSIMQSRSTNLDQRASPPLRQPTARRERHLATARHLPFCSLGQNTATCSIHGRRKSMPPPQY